MATGTVYAQTPVPLIEIVAQLKADPRGPYQHLGWFCPDGSIHLPNQPCGEPGGFQHGVLKDILLRLQADNGIYLGQILTGTDFARFLDQENNFSRAKQYALERFLRSSDDGWIMRKAQYYRGAVQAEDESQWGQEFLRWLLARDEFTTSYFYFARQIARDLPLGNGTDRAVRTRALAKALADSVPAFMNLRIKIHGRPDSTDLRRLEDFRQRHEGELSPWARVSLASLAGDLRATYSALSATALAGYWPLLPAGPVRQQLKRLLDDQLVAARGGGEAPRDRARAISDLLWTIRAEVRSTGSGEARLDLVELSLDLESFLLRTASSWDPRTLGELVEKNYVLAQAAAGCGFLEEWEWLEIRAHLAPFPDDRTTMSQLSAKAEVSSRALSWSTAMVEATYREVANKFTEFEPRARGFVADRIRNSIVLAFGETTGQLARVLADYRSTPQERGAIGRLISARGLNPGFSVGVLEVVRGTEPRHGFSPDKIYLLRLPPSDLQPVAGLISVSEGNYVSHVQLLARNLGIPNATIAAHDFERLADFADTRVFYAVSAQGRVVIKQAAEMSKTEVALTENRRQEPSSVDVPLDKVVLEQTHCLSLDSLRARDSGRICGPKAANLAELKFHFPAMVAPGFVLPFGIFRQHLAQPMLPDGTTYWGFLTATFAETARRREDSSEAAEKYVRARLRQLHEAIRSMPLLPAFKSDLRDVFARVLGDSLGTVPVFVRSDTNLEDLANFSGAGLNLTVPNLLPETAIWQAIREVWASPFTERSYRWRQRYLGSSVQVYPSVLILQSVDVEKSGVMVTAGLDGQSDSDIVVAFNRGVGGAVAGQSAETVLLGSEGVDVLLAPAREPLVTRLPATGGIVHQPASFETPVLNPGERADLRRVAADIMSRIHLTGTPGALDIELGFRRGEIWLFQVRPFVRNERARASAYLQAMDQPVMEDHQIVVTAKLDEKP